MQHKQIRPSDNNPGQQQVETAAAPQPSSWTSNEVAERRTLSPNISDSRPPSIPDVEGSQVSSNLTNLDSIRDALPDVQ